MRIEIVLLVILNFIWLEAYLNIYSKYKSKCAECDELMAEGRLYRRIIRLLEDRLSTLRKQRSKIYRLRKDIKRKDRAIVRYKAQNELFRNRYHESESRCEELRDEVLTKQATLDLAKRLYWSRREERDAYLYCLRQIQEEVTNAKEE